MIKVEIHSCVPGPGGEKVTLVTETGKFFSLPPYDGQAGVLISSMLHGQASDEHAVMFSFLTRQWEQTDLKPLFADIEFCAETGMVEGRIALYGSNEIGRKFFKIDVPVPFLLAFVTAYKMPLYLDDMTLPLDGAEKEGESGGKKARRGRRVAGS